MNKLLFKFCQKYNCEIRFSYEPIIGNEVIKFLFPGNREVSYMVTQIDIWNLATNEEREIEYIKRILEHIEIQYLKLLKNGKAHD